MNTYTADIDWSSVFLHSPSPAAILNEGFIVVACNQAYEALVGLAASAMIGRPVFQIFSGQGPEQQKALRASCLHAWESGKPHSLPLFEYYLGEDRQFWSLVNTPLADNKGKVRFLLSQPTNITELARWRAGHNPFEPAVVLTDTAIVEDRSFQTEEVQQILAVERRRFEQLFQQAPGFICVLRGPNHIYEMANHAYYQLVGHREIIGHELASVLPEVVPQGFLEKLDNAYRAGIPFIGRAVPIQLQRTAGEALEQRYIDLMYQPIRDDVGRITGVFVQGHDVTEAHCLSQQVSHQAVHDPLTGLANRRLLTDVGTSLDEDGGSHVLMYLDLDHFKVVNDRCGHMAGDELLVQVAEILTRFVGPEDILARVGGDEFVFIQKNCPEFVAREIANQLRHAIQELIFVWDGRRHGITLSIGMVTFGSRGKLSFVEALSLADSACFLAKEKGRNRVQESSPDDDEVHQQFKDMDWVSRIKEAIADDMVDLWGQTIESLSSDGGTPWIELLARIRDEEGNSIPPGSFIPAAERYGVVEALDYHIVKSAFGFFATLPRRDNELLFFINLSGHTLNSQDFPRRILEIAAQYPNVSPGNICFEVTETAAIRNLKRAAEAMATLQSAGFSFALDDFGSGMSSFSYLEYLPVNYVKIDGEFIRNLDSRIAGEAIVEAVTKVARAMGKVTIAEHVERPDLVPVLQRLGVDRGQGYGIHRPEPLASLLARL